MFGVSKALFSSLTLVLFAAAPSSTNFTLKSYDFGNGGGTSTSTNYGLNSEAGDQTGDQSSSVSYVLDGGTQNTFRANVPLAPTFTNPSSEYNRLRIVVDTGGNPTDTKYKVAISTDDLATTLYVKTDNTLGTTDTITQ